MRRHWNAYELRKFIEDLTGLECWNNKRDNFSAESFVIDFGDARDVFADNKTHRLNYNVTITFITEDDFELHKFDKLMSENFNCRRSKVQQEHLLLRHYKTNLSIDFTKPEE